MKTQQDTFVPAFDVTSTNGGELAGFARRLHGISDAASRVRRQLAQYAGTLDNTSLSQQAETLRTWMDINAEGLAVAARLADLGPAWAEDITTRLAAAAEGMERIAQEELDGGAAPMEARTHLIQVWSEVNGILSSMETLYQPAAFATNPGKTLEPAAAFVR